MSQRVQEVIDGFTLQSVLLLLPFSSLPPLPFLLSGLSPTAVFMHRLLFLLLFAFHSTLSTKCYSCSSTQLNLRWPKDESNKLLYLNEFPFFSNESCDQLRNALPVVDCPDSVCIKAVIKEPPAKREACVQGGAIVRDCWSRVMLNLQDEFSHRPPSKNNMIRLVEYHDSNRSVGHIYTCDGYLCNSIVSLSSFLFLPLFSLLH